MRIKVNIDTVGKPLDKYIEEKLETKGLPTCLGSMIPPIITRQVPFEDIDILIDKDAISKKEIIESDISNIVDANPTYCKDKVLGRSGAERLEKYKNDRAEQYTEQLIKCCSCIHVKICNQLTKNYLRVISIQEVIKLQDVIKSGKNI